MEREVEGGGGCGDEEEEIVVGTESCWSHVSRIHGRRRVDDNDEEADDAAPYRHGRVDALLVLSRAFGSRPLQPPEDGLGSSRLRVQSWSVLGDGRGIGLREVG